MPLNVTFKIHKIIDKSLMVYFITA